MQIQVNGQLIPQGGGDNIPLSRSPLIVGRRESSDICLQFPNVSGKHCELIFKDGLWILRDLESTNGVKVNGIRVNSGAKKVLHTGDVLTIGKRVFTLQYIQTGRPSDLEEYEEELENAMNIPLLDKAGLTHEPRHGRRARSDQPSPPADAE
ncbi:MAG TPA: FHA domain-containing protein [Gemmataceae bacterium]|nr:FHA domain-containing protein [Gemmataceae bacterium]